MTLVSSVIVCAHNEERYLPACLHALFAQTRGPDEILVVNNASTDATGVVAAQVPGVRMVDQPRKGLVSVTSLKHFPYVASSDFHKPKHLYSWKTLLRCRKDWPSARDALRDNVNVAITLYRNGAWAA